MKGYLLAAVALVAVIIIGGIAIFFLVGEPEQDAGISDTRAIIPYQAVYDMATFGKSEVHDPNMIFCIRVQSTLPKVTPSDISFYIDSISGSIPLRIDNEGIFELPLRSDLLEENPILVTNQPKGTMSLEGCIRFKGNSGSQPQEISYSALMMPATWMQKMQHSQAAANGQTKIPRISGINIRILESNGMPLVIRSNKEEISLQPNENGICFIPFKEVLLLENPMVSFPGKNVETMEVVMEEAG
ncbi:hypothetical protein ACFLZT_01490 [Thermodesulfobacteriota bacterium]